MEIGLLLAVLLVLAWGFLGLRQSGDPERLRLDQALAPGPLTGWGQARVATLCHRLELPARQAWRWSFLCRNTEPAQALGPDAFADALAADLAALQRAIAAGAERRQAALQPLARSAGEGVLAPHEAERLRGLTRELTAYRAHYRMSSERPAGSLLLACAWQATGAGPSGLANRLALVRGAPALLWWPADAAPDAPADAGCRALGQPAELVSQGAVLAQRVRSGSAWADKSRAMERLLLTAPWLIAGWSLLAWALLSLATRTQRPLRLLGPALLAWAAAGALSGLTLPASGAPVPLLFWAGLALAGGLLLAASRSARLERMALFAPGAPPGERPPWALPLFVGFVGGGWWLVLDLSLNGHLQNRYLGLRHALAVFAALVLLSVLPLLARNLARIGLAWAGLLTNALRPGRSGWLRPVALWLVYAVLVLGIALATRGWRQLTGEALSLLLLVGVAWFFLLRSTRWARGGNWRDLASSLAPLVLHAGVVLAAFVLTDDLGPLLVALLAAAIYAGAFAAQALLLRGARWPLAGAVGLLATLMLGSVLLLGLLAFARLPVDSAQRVAERIESMRDPFSAENDQLARVRWLGRHTPASGWGLGAVPWCGTQAGAGCPGVPAQMQSDYSFAALRAVLGTAPAFALLGLYLLGITALAVRQAARSEGTLGARDPASAALAWLAVCWAVLVLVQTLVTAGGNLGVLPLTGVTWPFVSYGIWSLLHHSLVLGLVMHRGEG
ncbi:FtsW/RodA/SpoVE family cell cycle protein [Ramlibacter sp. AW1]|uniref:Probable peptidoglycan glycosyltransferase FtsW n=1 Tax=Ramlibacter aurantiacus TaxID=2801330 RepID=A0A936ZNA6_9BURK|nr:FtsW/RodA/SpoVE family cell cycle protein [Ramlibacter aurantiacus]MBL0419366.1 FtsW/RodA/SpoVE family cell cycle protein [Ramlibacter aurantiacus]